MDTLCQVGDHFLWGYGTEDYFYWFFSCSKIRWMVHRDLLLHWKWSLWRFDLGWVMLLKRSPYGSIKPPVLWYVSVWVTVGKKICVIELVIRRILCKYHDNYGVYDDVQRGIDLLPNAYLESDGDFCPHRELCVTRRRLPVWRCQWDILEMNYLVGVSCGVGD